MLVKHPEGALVVDASLGDDVGRGSQASLGDVKEGEYLGVGVGDDVAGESSEGGAARAAGVHQGGHASPNAAEVRVDPVAGNPVENMGVEVYEPRRNYLSRNIHHLRCFIGRDAGSDAGDSPVLDGNIVDGVCVGVALGCIYQGAAS